MRGTGSRAGVEKEGKEETSSRTKGKREKSRDRVQDKVMEKKILMGCRLKMKESKNGNREQARMTEREGRESRAALEDKTNCWA